MKWTIALLSMFSLATAMADVTCKRGDLILKFEPVEETSTGVLGFVTLTGGDEEFSGEAYLRSANSSFGLSEKYALAGNFPEGTLLNFTKRLQSCGRGACEGGEITISAKLQILNENIYFLGCK